MSPRLTLDRPLHPFRVRNARGEAVAVPAPDAEFTHLQFRRYAGCPICNLHLQTQARRGAELRAAGIRSVVFFHSAADELKQAHATLPFDVIADPGKQHYRRFGVERSWLGLLHPRAWWSGLRGLLRHGVSLRARGGVTGLPAEFLVARDGRIHALHYGTHADDHWSVDELLAHARAAAASRRHHAAPTSHQSVSP